MVINSIDQCFNVTKTCPICKQGGFQYEWRRLYFSSGSPSYERDDPLTIRLRQTVGRQQLEIEAAQKLFKETDYGKKEVERWYRKALDKERSVSEVLDRIIDSMEQDIEVLKENHERKIKKKEAEFAVAEENINKAHAVITKGLHKEIQHYESKLLTANEKMKVWSTIRVNKKRADNTGTKKKPTQADTMEQRVKKLEKQVEGLQISINQKKQSEGSSSKKRPNKLKGSKGY